MDAVTRQRIAAILRHAREAKGLTQGQLAVRMGISNSAVSNYEKARRPILAEELAKFARVLGFPVAYFYAELDSEEFGDAEAIHWLRYMAPHLKPAARATLKALYEQSDREAKEGRAA